MTEVIISGTGHYLPEKVLTNADLEKIVETSSDWIMERVGIESRHIAADEEMASDMGTKAAQAAIEAAGLDVSEIDQIIVGTTSPDNRFPSTACVIQDNLNLNGCPAYDVIAACSGFIYAMDVATQAIQTGRAKHVLVIGVEVMSRLIDWTDRNTCVLFGDGAGAAVLSASDRQGIMSTHIHAAGKYKDLLYAPNLMPGQHIGETNPFVRMQGREVFKTAVNTLGQLVVDTLAANDIGQDDIDWLIPHQANRRIIEATAKKLSMPMSKVVLTLPTHGNTSCASIPLALDVAVRDGRVKRGDLLLMEAFGGGFTWGSALVRF